VVLALMLNRVRLRPDEAVFMPAGNLHAYLGGVGIEVMAASDNVLRGGLTRKHVDVPELLRVLRYEPLLDPVLQPRERAPGVVGWDTPAAEFALVKAVASAGSPPMRVPGGGPRIVVCTAGRARCRAGASTLSLGPGEAAFLGAAEPFLELSAEAEQAVVFQASSSG
jgi:mannose-6-phosphate isomerase